MSDPSKDNTHYHVAVFASVLTAIISFANTFFADDLKRLRINASGDQIITGWVFLVLGIIVIWICRFFVRKKSEHSAYIWIISSIILMYLFLLAFLTSNWLGSWFLYLFIVPLFVFLIGVFHFSIKSNTNREKFKQISWVFVIATFFIAIITLYDNKFVQLKNDNLTPDSQQIENKDWSGLWVLKDVNDLLSDNVVVVFDKGINIKAFYVNNNTINNFEGTQQGASISGDVYNVSMEVNGSFDFRQTINNTFVGDIIINNQKQTWNATLEEDSEKIREKLFDVLDISIVEPESVVQEEGDVENKLGDRTKTPHSPVNSFASQEKWYINNYNYVYIGKFSKSTGFIDTRLLLGDGSAPELDRLPTTLITAEGKTTRFKKRLDDTGSKGFQYEYKGVITIDPRDATDVTVSNEDISEIWVRFTNIKISER